MLNQFWPLGGNEIIVIARKKTYALRVSYFAAYTDKAFEVDLISSTKNYF